MACINVSKYHRRLNEVNAIGQGDLKNIVFQARRTTSLTLPMGTFVDIELDTTDFETPEFQHDTVNRDRINVLDAGFTGIYMLSYNVSVETIIGSTWAYGSSRIRVDDSSTLAASESEKNYQFISFGSPFSQPGAFHHSFYFICGFPCFLTLQVNNTLSAVTTTLLEAQVNIIKIEGGIGNPGIPGLTDWIGPWVGSTNYQPNNIVSDSGNAFVALTDNTGSQPPSADWSLLAQKGDKGAVWQGTWAANNFVVGDVVIFEGSAYNCILDTTAAQAPNNTTYWSLLTQKGDTGAGSSTNAKIFDGYHTGGISLTATFADITLDTERQTNTVEYTHAASSAEVTINSTGTYLIFAHISTDVTVGAARSAAEMKLQIDTGGGFVDIPGTTSFTYNRISTAGKGSCDVTLALNVTTGDIIKIQARRFAGTDTVVTQNTSSLTIIKVNSFVYNYTDTLKLFDDFYGDTIDNIWATFTNGAGSSVNTGNGVGGVLEIESGAANISKCLNYNSKYSNVSYQSYIQNKNWVIINVKYGYQIWDTN